MVSLNNYVYFVGVMAGNRLGLEPQILTRQNFAKKGSFF